jgi:hypothetical protein
MSDLCAYLAAAALFAFAVYRLRTDRPAAPYQTQHYGYCLLICLALTMAMLAPSMPRSLAGLGLSHGAVLLGDAVRTAAMSLLMFMACAVGRRPVRGLPVLAAVATQLASAALFLAARPAVGPDGDALLTDGTGRWLLAAYDALFAGYAAWALATAAAAFGREARRTGPGPLRTGIRLSLAALAVGMAWTAWTVDDIVIVLRTGVQDGSEDLVSNALGALCAALIVAAALVAKWHALYTGTRDRVRTYRVYRRLTPLWKAIRAELPQIALDADRRMPWGGRSLDFALYRRVIEIHDGRLALRPYAPGTPRALSAESTAADRHEPRKYHGPHVEAAAIAAALENHRAGRFAAAGDSAHGPETVRTVTAEAAWLADVATAFSRICKTRRIRPPASADSPPMPRAGMYPEKDPIHISLHD